MKKFISTISLVAVLMFLFMPAFIFSAVSNPTESLPTKEQVSGLSDKAGIEAVLNSIVNWVFAVMVVVGTIFVILAAFQFVTGGGDPAKVAEARQKLIWAILGFAVAVLARAILPLVKSLLGITA